MKPSKTLLAAAFCLCLIPAQGQERVFTFSASAPLTEFMDDCYFLTDSAYYEQQYPPVGAAFRHSSETDMENMPKRYWMRFSIRNENARQESIQLFLGLSEILDFYVPSDKGYQRFPIGNYESRKLIRRISGTGKTFLAQAVVTLGPGETQTYFAYFNHQSSGMQANRDTKLSPRLIAEPVWAKQSHASNAIWNVVFGCFLILILYHFVYYFLTKDNIYLYYCLFVFSVAFPFLTLTRDVVDRPEFNALLFFSVSGFFSVFYFQLARKFIPIQELLPRWDKILRYYIAGKTGVVIFYSLAHLITQDIFVILSLYIPAIVIELVLMVFLAIALIQTRDRISLAYVAGSSIAWAGMLFAILNADPELSFTPQLNPFKYAAPSYGFVMESLFFAMVLAYRAKLNEIERKQAKDALIEQLQENKALQEKANRELEMKVVERTAQIEEERQKSETLLLNVLPKAIVDEMKINGTTRPKRFNDVSVLIADFVGFTAIAERLSPEELVQHLDFFFKNFDAIAARNHMEKIKTIGDAYMCVCGLPDPDAQHAVNAVRTALEFQAFLEHYNRNKANGEHIWRLRIGIQSGPIVAGVIGDYKFTYDIWGDTVNTASRLEQHSEGGKVNISQDVYDLVHGRFAVEKRGTVDVKNKGVVQMYFVTGEKA